MNCALPILQVEDEPNDHYLLQRAFAAVGVPNVIQVVHDGQEAIDYLAGNEPFSDRTQFPLPCLILLDLKMPRRDGFEVLRWIRQDGAVRCLPVIMFSSSAHEEDVERAYELGANSFVTKMNSLKEREDFARAVRDYWVRFNVVCPSLERAQH